MIRFRILGHAELEGDASTTAAYRAEAAEIYAGIRDCDLTPLIRMSA